MQIPDSADMQTVRIVEIVRDRKILYSSTSAFDKQ